MKYISTRSREISCDGLRAVLAGMAPDGGLFLPESFDDIQFNYESCVNGCSTKEIATKVIGSILPDFENMKELVEKAYNGKFETEDITPLVKVGDNYVLELFRGPTSAFKDVALSMLPQLISAAKRQTGDSKKTMILTATSGDTGKAALEGFHDVPGVGIIVFFPENGVSEVQKLQMVTQQGNNVHVCAIKGNFDDAQTGVKKVFELASKDAKLLENTGTTLSSANSINIGRLAPQLTYYFKAYSDLVRQGRIKVGDEVDFSVPTGNFGDILAGYFAKRLGLPIGRLICASNANNVLTEFLTTGIYNRKRPFIKTTSPSMDILVSSNLERMLFLASNGDTQKVAGWMEELKNSGEYKVDGETLKNLQDTYFAGYCDDKTASAAIAKVFKNYGYVCDTHTAVAWNVAEQYAKSEKAAGKNPMVVLSTASPYKFPLAVLAAIEGTSKTECDEFEAMERLSKLSGTPIPPGLAGLRSKEILHKDTAEKNEITDYVLSKIKK